VKLTIQQVKKEFAELTLNGSIIPPTYVDTFRSYNKTMKDMGAGFMIPESILIEMILAKVEDDTYTGLIDMLLAKDKWTQLSANKERFVQEII